MSTAPGELRGRLVTPDGVVSGILRFDERLRELEPADLDGPLVLPGFIDAHVHGGGGGDTMDGPEGVRRLARFHLDHGTTTLLPTTITNPWERVLAALEGVRRVRNESWRSARDDSAGPSGAGAAAPDEPLPDLPGAHLEGPFINPERLGAQPPHTVLPERDRVEEVLALGVVRVVTLAPEMAGAIEAARSFAAAGVRVSVGHTGADYAEVMELERAVREEGGTVGFTHLFNAMGGIQGRAPGPAGAALALRGAYAELIYDTHHVAEGALHAARAAKGEGLLLVTDAMRAAGMPEGATELGGQEVIVSEGAARLRNGSLAGSVLTLDGALRNVLGAGVPLLEATRMLSANPARYLGLGDRGEIRLGQRADLVVLDEEARVQQVYLAGRRVR